MSDLKPNAELAYRVLDQIDAHPKTWDQRTWARRTNCGTAFCFAGWAVVLAGRQFVQGSEPSYVVDRREPDGEQWVGDAAREALGIEDSVDLFRSYNGRERLGDLVAEIFGPRPGGAA